MLYLLQSRTVTIINSSVFAVEKKWQD